MQKELKSHADGMRRSYNPFLEPVPCVHTARSVWFDRLPAHHDQGSTFSSPWCFSKESSSCWLGRDLSSYCLRVESRSSMKLQREFCDKQTCSLLHFQLSPYLSRWSFSLLVTSWFWISWLYLDDDNRCMRSRKVNFYHSGTVVAIHQKNFAATEIVTRSAFSLVL